MSVSRLSVRDLTYTALGIALIAVCSWISVPAGIPFTLQTFAVCLVTALLGLRLGMISVAGYLLLGAIGLPVFSGFRGGPGALMGPTGGYLVGFLLTAAAVGLAVNRWGRGLPVLLISMAGGILICYAFGTAWFMAGYAGKGDPVSLGKALSMCVIPFLIPDALKTVLAAVLTRRLYPILSGGRFS